MAVSSKGIFIIGAKRTPFCKYGGSLRELPASHAFAAAARDAMQSANIQPTLVDATIVGNVNFLSQCDGGKTARYCGTYSGVPIDKAALGVNKICGTGLQSLITGALEITTGLASVTLNGGTEIMSALPYVVRNVRFGTALGGSYKFEDYITSQTADDQGLTLRMIAEEFGKKHGVSKKEADEFALGSHLKWHAAETSGVFKNEISKVPVTLKRKELVIEKDELPNPGVNSIEQLMNIQDPYHEGSIVTAGNSAAPSDGAAAILLASEESTKQHNFSPLARIVGWSCVGVDPMDSGLGAEAAVKVLLEKTGRKIGDIDLFELNETFATEALVSARRLQLDPSKMNVSGGAIAAGNPVAATGARMVVHLVHQLKNLNKRTAVAASSCGGGQGVAILLEMI